jgi:hypothetical protein
MLSAKNHTFVTRLGLHQKITTCLNAFTGSIFAALEPHQGLYSSTLELTKLRSSEVRAHTALNGRKINIFEEAVL